MTDPLTALILIILAFAAGLVIGRLFNVIKADDEAMLTTELEYLTLATEQDSKVIINLRAENDRLQADNARLQAELDELRRRLDALGSIDWGRVGE